MAWKFFTAQGQEKQVTNPGEGYGSSFPASPADGQIYNYVADATNGVVWRFRYNAGSGSAYKWEFLGGAPLYATIGTISVPNSAWVNGESIVIPRSGDYEYELNLQGATFNCTWWSFIGPTGVQTEGITAYTTVSGGGGFPLNHKGLLTGLVGGTTYYHQASQNSGSTQSTGTMKMFIRPRRVS